LALLSIPHLFWRASIAVSDVIPLTFECLLDNGSHLVLIHNLLIDDLAICHHKLLILIETKLVMWEGNCKVVVKMYEYVKLWLHDSSGEYCAQTVQAIIAPNLTAPGVLSLPFLTHNSITLLRLPLIWCKTLI